ncbi:MAG: putative zinc-binding metallopeptidase [Limisphaerales bacterium]
MDTLETAASFGVSVDPDNQANNGSKQNSARVFDEGMDFDALLTEWVPLTCALNSINRGMGLSDLYPFVIPPAVVEKLRFIHDVINGSKQPVKEPVGGRTNKTPVPVAA